MKVRVAGLLKCNKRLLLAKHRKDGQEYWVVPGGGVKRGETLREALQREFLEETNLSVETGDLLFANDFIRPDLRRHVLNLYFEVRTEDPSGIHVEDHEVLKGLAFFTSGELAALPVRPDIGGLLIGYLEGKELPQLYLGPK